MNYQFRFIYCAVLLSLSFFLMSCNKDERRNPAGLPTTSPTPSKSPSPTPSASPSPTPFVETACPSIKPPHWKFVKGKCRPSCGYAASQAGYGGSGSDKKSGTSDDPHIFTSKASSCGRLNVLGHNDWREFEFKDAGKTITSNDAHEVANKKGSVCCGRGSAKNPIPPPEVTGLSNDNTERLSKQFSWGCQRNDKTENCKYRSVINTFSKHTFRSSVSYTNKKTVTQSSVSKKTTYYLHVQAAFGRRESAVKSVSFKLKPRPTPRPSPILPTPKVTGLESDTSPARSKSWEWSCSTEGTYPCEYRHVINQRATHKFDSKATYSSKNTASTSGKSDGRWYLHVQAKNAGAISAVKSVFVRIDRTKPKTPNKNSMIYDASNTHQITVTFRDFVQGERVRLYNVSNCKSSSLGVATVGDNGEGVITFTADSTLQNYYAQVTDQAGNVSGCGLIFAYPVTGTAILPEVTGLTNDDTPQRIKRWRWGL